MVFKINISEKGGKTYHLDSEASDLNGKELHQKVEGIEISPELHGYEFEIVGASDKAGFPLIKSVDGILLRRVLLRYGTGMKKRSKREGKRKRSNFTPKGLRLRKTARGKIISQDTVQINLKVLKKGNKELSEIFSDQNRAKEEKKAEAAPAQ